jgi:hypothetical protein
MKPTRTPFVRAAAVLGLLLAALLSARAEDTNLAAAPVLDNETHITSHHGFFDLNSRQLIYEENVKVDDPRMHLTCEYLTAKFPPSGTRHVDSIVAETNVVVLISTNDTTYTIKAAKAVYLYQPGATSTNETLELSGTPAPTVTWLESGDAAVPQTNEFKASRILWDIARNRVSADDHQGTFPDFGSNARRHKPSPATTNAPPSALPTPPAATNIAGTNATMTPPPANP